MHIMLPYSIAFIIKYVYGRGAKGNTPLIIDSIFFLMSDVYAQQREILRGAEPTLNSDSMDTYTVYESPNTLEPKISTLLFTIRKNAYEKVANDTVEITG